MTQYELFLRWLDYVAAGGPELATAERALDLIVGAAQNEPPLGERDDSVDNFRWEMMKRAHTAVASLNLSRDILEHIKRTAPRAGAR